MILEILLFLLASIVCYCLYSYKKLHKYFDDRGIKYLSGLPLFGNVIGITFMKRHILDELDKVYNAFPDEKYVGFLEHMVPVILVRDPELMKSITIKDFVHFTDHKKFFNAETDPLFADSLLFIQGKKWQAMRKTLSPAFTASKLKLILPIILEISNNVVEYLKDHQNNDINVDDLMRRYTTDVIASAGFGLQVNSLKDRDNEFYRIGHDILDFNLKQRLLMMMNMQFPKLSKKSGWRLYPDEVYEFFSNIVAATMEFRKKENVTRPDMIQLLMETRQEWTPEDLAGQVFIFFAAGFDSSATALIMTIYELSIHQEIQDKLYQECINLKQEENTYDKLMELKYLESVINESLRKWCPAIFMSRVCTKSFELPPPREGGKPYMVQPGEILYNLVNQVQLDAKYWPEPNKFNPDRFSEENKHKIKHCTFMPFGIGPRGCIGIRFAMMEIKMLLYSLILNFKILKTSKTQDPITIKPHNINLRAIGGINVQFEKRVSSV